MIKGFEQETAPLNDIELDAAQAIEQFMKAAHVGCDRAVSSRAIAEGMARWSGRFRDSKGRPYLNGARIRKIFNYLRMNTCPNILANSNGYYISNDKEEMLGYIDSLYARASAIQAVANRMRSVIV